MLRFDSDRLFAPRPNAELDPHGWDLRTDSRGFRGPELSSPKPDGAKRMLFIEDSVICGWGVDEEDTFVDILCRAVPASGRNPQGPDELDDIRNSRFDPHMYRKGHRQDVDKILAVSDELKIAQ